MRFMRLHPEEQEAVAKTLGWRFDEAKQKWMLDGDDNGPSLSYPHECFQHSLEAEVAFEYDREKEKIWERAKDMPEVKKTMAMLELLRGFSSNKVNENQQKGGGVVQQV